MQPKEWIDRYVNEVGRRLPGKQRSDVEMEMRSLIEDELDGLGHAPEEREVLAVLAKFGPPDEIAVRYGAPNVLIGPVLLPVFRIVAGIVLAIQAAVVLFAIAVGVGVGGEMIDPLESLAGLAGGLLQTFGMIVLIFALVERFGDTRPEPAAKPWDPRTLPAVEDQDRVKVGETVASMVFLAVLIVLFNTSPRWTGITHIGDGAMVVPIMADAFWAYAPWLTIVWGAELMLKAVVLLRGRWGAATRIVNIMISGAGLFILFHMLTSPEPLLAFAPADPGLRVGLAVIFTFAVIEIVQQLYRLFKGWRSHSAAIPV